MIEIIKSYCDHGKQKLCLEYRPPILNPSDGNTIDIEPLPLTIYSSPKNEFERKCNDDMMARASSILEMRRQDIESGKIMIDFKHAGFLEFYKSFAKKASYNYNPSCRAFEEFCGGVCSYERLTVEYCERFAAFLLSQGNISSNTATIYYRQFQRVIGAAYEHRLIPMDPRPFLAPLPLNGDVPTRHVTDDEIRSLLMANCSCQATRKKVCFILLTGMRYGEVEKLLWEDIHTDVYGRSFIHRSGKYNPLYLSDEAMSVIRPRQKYGHVFRHMSHRNALIALNRWAESSGIKRRLTFECFRVMKEKLPV